MWISRSGPSSTPPTRLSFSARSPSSFSPNAPKEPPGDQPPATRENPIADSDVEPLSARSAHRRSDLYVTSSTSFLWLHVLGDSSVAHPSSAPASPIDPHAPPSG